jgi:hypothetical protein
VRYTILARLALGALGLLRPRRAAVLWGADPDLGTVEVVARILGARHLAQATLLAAHPTRGAHLLSTVVDLLHAATMVLLAARSARFRRPAATSACIAVALAAATSVTSRKVGLQALGRARR